jgi:hypothetical protein
VKKPTWEDWSPLEPEHRPRATWEDAIKVPDHPPFPWLHPPDDLKKAGEWLEAFNSFEMVAHLAWRLIDSAWQLAMLSRRHAGRFAEGMALPELSVAAAAGAITLACAAFEAALDETALELTLQARDDDLPGRARASELTRSLPPRERVEALLALCEQPFGWDREPFQSLGLVLSVRRHLLHHEVEFYPTVDGNWPVKRLKELPQRLKSPYRGRPGLEWHQHVLTPDGAEWAVRSMYSVIGILEYLWHDLPDELLEETRQRAEPPLDLDDTVPANPRLEPPVT